MKNILKFLGAVFASIFKKTTGVDSVLVEIPSVDVSQETINHVIDIVNRLKTAVNSGVTILLVDLIPGTLDNRIRQFISDGLVPILAGLTFSKKWLESADKDVLLDDLLSKVRFADDADKDALYHALAARLIVVASDGKVTWSEAASLIELYFKQIFLAGKKA